MKKFVLGSVLSGLSAISIFAATTPLYINNAPLFAPPATPPQIDATAFLNQSTFDVSSVFGGFIFVVGDTAFALGSNVEPFEMMNTRFVTNAPGAFMVGSPGFRFDHFSAANNARLAQTAWENRGLIIGSPVISVRSTNILNRGALQVNDLGLLKLEGTNVNLSRSTLLAGTPANSFPPSGGGITGTNHNNAPGVNDIYWGAGLNNRVTNGAPPMRIDTLIPTNFITPAHQVVRRAGTGLFTNLVTIPALTFLGYTNYVYTNAMGDVQVVYLNTANLGLGITADVRFVPGGPNGGADVIVAIESIDHDILTNTDPTNGVYFVDHSAFTTNIDVTWNGPAPLGQNRTRRPDTYELFRGRPFGWDSALATNGNSDITNVTFYSTNTVSNTVVMGYAAYSASWAGPAFTNITFGGAVIPPPGRVEVYGDSVNLDRTRIRAETTVIIKARDLASNTIAQVDAPILLFDIASTSPPLVIRDLAPTTVRRFSGQLAAWSGSWERMERDPVNTNVTTTTRYHVLVINPSAVSETGVSTTDLLLAADQVTIDDDINVTRAFRIDARDWTVTGSLSTPTGYSLGPTNVIGLVNFTNLGLIDIGGSANLGRGEDVSPLDNYVIAPGSIFFASGHRIGAASVQLGGTLSAFAGGISIVADSVNLSGLLSANSDIEISADTVVASNSFITAGSPGVPASLIFDVPGSFTDAGIGAQNEWTAHGGIQVLSLPGTGDLLGTTVRIPLVDFGEAVIRWPSADFGASAGGFVNNLALGRLELNGGLLSLFRFEGPGAIYIDRLELNADPVNDIQISPDMTVYFADSNVDPTILDGLHGGRLRFVSGFAGPLNSTNIVYPSGETYTFNTALVTSTTLDSDGDGIVNALDATPVVVGDRIDLKIACSRGSATRRTVISWMAPANSTSIVEYKDSLHATTWQALPAVQNTGAAQRLSLSEDLPATAARQRFYRVRTE